MQNALALLDAHPRICSTHTLSRARVHKRCCARSTERNQAITVKPPEEGEAGHAKRRSHIRMGHWRQHCTVSDHGLRLFTVPYLISLPGTLLGAKYLARETDA